MPCKPVRRSLLSRHELKRCAWLAGKSSHRCVPCHAAQLRYANLALSQKRGKRHISATLVPCTSSGCPLLVCRTTSRFSALTSTQPRLQQDTLIMYKHVLQATLRRQRLFAPCSLPGNCGRSHDFPCQATHTPHSLLVNLSPEQRLVASQDSSNSRGLS